jgi:predicted ATPase
MLRLAEAEGDRGLMLEALFVPALTRLYRGELEVSLDACEKGLALYDPEACRQHARKTGQNAGVTMRCYWSLALWHLGYPDQALKACEQTVALAREVAHPFSLAYAYHHAAWLHQHCRLGRTAQQFGQAAIDMGVEQGFAFWGATGSLYRGGGLLLEGKNEEGLADVRQGLEGYRATGAELALPYYLSFLADGLARTGQKAEALAALEEAFAAAYRCHDLFHEPELFRLRGELRAGDDPAAAEADFRRAVEISRERKARSWGLRASMSLGSLWHSQGRTAEARELVAEAFGGFSEGFGTPDLVAARELLDRWGA